MKLAIFGATGQVGSALVRQALADGHEVRAYARPSSATNIPAAARAIVGELDDEGKLREAIRGADAVISALGARSNTVDQPPLFAAALERITRIMREERVRRLVSISGAGLWLPNDPPSFPRKLVTTLMKVVAKHVLAAKEREAEVITTSDLEWILVRPGRIVAGEPTGKVAASFQAPPRAKITRGDVAQYMLEAVGDASLVRRAPMIG